MTKRRFLLTVGLVCALMLTGCRRTIPCPDGFINYDVVDPAVAAS